MIYVKQCPLCGKTWEASRKNTATCAQCAGAARRLKGLPEPLRNGYVKYGFIELIDALKYDGFPYGSPTVSIHFTCVSCEKGTIIKAKRLFKKRTSQRGIPLCGPCALAAALSSEEWRKKNSEAQLKIQGTVEQKAKNRAGVLRHRKDNPEVALRINQALIDYNQSDAGRKRQADAQRERCTTDEEFMSKFCSKSHYAGWYESKFGRIFFASAWELSFIMHCETNPLVKSLWRCKDRIPYTGNGKRHLYLPDFEVAFTNRDVMVLEIKGNLQSRSVQREKETAARQFFGDRKRFVTLYEDGLKAMKVRLDSKHIITEQLNLGTITLIRNERLEKMR